MNVHLPHHIQMVYFRANSDTNFAKLPKSKQNYPNPSKMAQIWPEYLITGLKSIILAPWILAFGQRPRRGRSPVNTGKICPSVHLSPLPHPQGLSPLGPKSKLYGPNPSKMVQICPKLAKSRQNGLRPGKMGLIWLENLNSGLSSIILAP